MATYSVRCIFRWAPRADQTKRHLYEERITVWAADTLDEAIELAEAEAAEYASEGEEFLRLSQGFWMFEDLVLPRQGIEVFSLLRESDLEPREYLDAFFDTGLERQAEYEGEES